jgi:hypothetical protein
MNTITFIKGIPFVIKYDLDGITELGRYVVHPSSLVIREGKIFYLLKNFDIEGVKEGNGEFYCYQMDEDPFKVYAVDIANHQHVTFGAMNTLSTVYENKLVSGVILHTPIEPQVGVNVQTFAYGSLYDGVIESVAGGIYTISLSDESRAIVTRTLEEILILQLEETFYVTQTEEEEALLNVYMFLLPRYLLLRDAEKEIFYKTKNLLHL